MASTSGRRVIVPLVNRSGGAVAAGDVVVIGDGTNDACFTTTTTASFNARHIGIAQEAIASLATGRVLTNGYASIVNSAASLTRDHFLFTSTVAKEATGSATRAAGAFGQVLTTGTDTICLIWGVPDVIAAGASVAKGAHVRRVATQSITTGAGALISFDTEDVDDNGLYAAGTPTRLTAVEAKWSIVHCGMQWAAHNTGQRKLGTKINGAAVHLGTTFLSGAAGNDPIMSVSHAWKATAGDYAEFEVFQSSGGNLNVTVARANIIQLPT